MVVGVWDKTQWWSDKGGLFVMLGYLGNVYMKLQIMIKRMWYTNEGCGYIFALGDGDLLQSLLQLFGVKPQ